MPGIHQLKVMFGYNLLDPPQFLCREATATFQADGVKPKLRLAVVTFHMNMRRFPAVTGVEEKAVRSTPQDCGHRALPKVNRDRQKPQSSPVAP